VSEHVHDEIDNTEEEGSSSLAWFLTGAIIGATVAMLYAPKTGRETRQLIADRTQQSRDAVAEGGKEIIDAGREMFERGRKLVEDAADLFERGRKLVRG
jgi:gas vesicle protein